VAYSRERSQPRRKADEGETMCELGARRFQQSASQESRQQPYLVELVMNEGSAYSRLRLHNAC
jgi:hypothetical protein